MSPFLAGFLGGLLGAAVLIFGSGLILAHGKRRQRRRAREEIVAYMRASAARAQAEAAISRELRAAEERASGH